MNRRRVILWILLVAFCIGGLRSATGQVLPGQSYPSIQYFLQFGEYYGGEYQGTYKEFASSPGVLRFGSDRYLDSCCSWTMAGECQFHTGGYSAAMAFYEQSLNLYSAYLTNHWQSRVVNPQIPNALPNAVQRTQITWGTSTRSFQIPSLPDGLQVQFGDLNSAQNVLAQGGTFNPAQLKLVDVGEIMRCNALAMHRRRWLKGTLCRFEPLSTRLVTQLSQVNCNDGSLIGAWNGVMLGLAQSSIADYENAKRTLQNGLQFGGGFDHQLTPVALVELAEINYLQGDLQTAAFLALEASYSAAIFGQYDLLEEALSLGATIHMETQQPGVYAPLQPAIGWCSKNRARLPQISLAIRLAECYCEAGDPNSSTSLLADASRAFSSRTGFGAGELSGRANYLLAENLFLTGDFEKGLIQLQKAVADFSSASRWIYQLSLAENYVLSGAIPDRHAQTLYAILLRDPTEREWRSDPLESITFLASPHLPSIDRWLQLTIADRNYRQAIHVAELLRRHRFFAELPLAGREMAFRWMMHAPKQAITSTAETQRVDFLSRYPAYREVSEAAEKLRLELVARPLQFEDGSDEQKENIKRFVDLMKASELQESLLFSIALQREPAEMLFPPQFDVEEMQRNLAKHQTVLYVVETANLMFFFEITTEGIRLLSQHATRDVATAVNRFFHETKLEERELLEADLDNMEWKVLAQEMWEKLIPGLTLRGTEEQPSELVIIPSGITWYFPFEALCQNSGETTEYLTDRARIRYAPTMGLAVLPQRPTPNWKRSAFFAGELSKNLDEVVCNERVELVKKDFPAIATFPEKMDVPSAWFGAACDEFIVWADMGKTPSDGPLGITPVQKDRGRNGSRLANWMSLPWSGAEHVVLPLFDSEGSRGFRGKNPGDELFLTSMALLASGTKTVMISRWATGGKSALDFSETYWRESRSKSPIESMELARKFMRDQAVDFEHEPRLHQPKTPIDKKANHPLFWSGYMVFDVPSSSQENLQLGDLVNSDKILEQSATAVQALTPAKADEVSMDAASGPDPATSESTETPLPGQNKKDKPKKAPKEPKKKKSTDDPDGDG